MKYSQATFGRAEAVFNKLGGDPGVDAFLSGETTVCRPDRRWCEHGGIIYFSVTSDGTTGEQWVPRLEDKGIKVSDYAKSVLLSPDFRPTNDVTVEVAVLKGPLFEDADRITSKIRAEAASRRFATPQAEIACLIREYCSDGDIAAMGLIWLVTMHQPINDSVGGPRLLDASRDGDGPWLDACYVRPGLRWRRGNGFAFVVAPACNATA